jgi:type VI secretion system protein ImpH
MEAEDRASGHPLISKLRKNAGRFDFFLAARILDAIARSDPSLSARLGLSEHPYQDPVRFCQKPELHFSGRALEKYEDPGPDHPARLFVNFLGLLGPNGPMPLHVTEYIHDREHNFHDSTLARFFDLFNHRMVSLFYRAWAVNQMAVSRDRGADDSFARFVGSFLGVGMESFRDRDSIPYDARLFYAGRLAPNTRNREGLEAILSHFFDVPFHLREFEGHWMHIPQDFQMHLGRSPETGTLGRNAIIGSSIWECTQKFRIRVGPMTLKDYLRMLPGGRSFRRLRDWVRFYTTDELTWDARLVLRREEVPRIELGKVGRLGWTTWVRSRPIGRDGDDLWVRPQYLHTVRPPDPADDAQELRWAPLQSPEEFPRPVPETEAPAPEEPAGPPEAEETEAEEEILSEWGAYEDGILESEPEELLTHAGGDADLAAIEKAVEEASVSDPSLSPEEELPEEFQKLVDKTLLRLDQVKPPEEE